MRLLVVVLAVGVCLPSMSQTAATGHPAGARPATGMMDTGPPPPPQPLPHPTTEAQLREFLSLTDAEIRVHKDMDQAVQTMRAKAPAYFPPAILDEISANLKALNLVQIYLPYYQAYVSEQDMSALLTFYRSDAGKHYAAVQGQLFASAQMILSGDVQTVVQNALFKHKDEIQAAKKKSEEQTAPAPK